MSWVLKEGQGAWNEGGLKGGELGGALKAREIIRGFILTTWGSH